jgi:hypothetical protein
MPTEFNLVIEPTNSTISPGGRIEDRKGASKTFLRLTASPVFLSPSAQVMKSSHMVYFDLGTCPVAYAETVLDPLVFGVVPESLLPVIAYACFVGVFGWVVVGNLVMHLIRVGVSVPRGFIHRKSD